MNNKKIWVNYAKGIGIILVVYGHVLNGIYKAGIDVSEQFYYYSYNIIYSFHMPLFFLSGLFVHQSLHKRGSKEFIKNKVRVIVYPYIVWSAIQGLIKTEPLPPEGGRFKVLSAESPT